MPKGGRPHLLGLSALSHARHPPLAWGRHSQPLYLTGSLEVRGPSGLPWPGLVYGFGRPYAPLLLEHAVDVVDGLLDLFFPLGPSYYHLAAAEY